VGLNLFTLKVSIGLQRTAWSKRKQVKLSNPQLSFPRLTPR